MSRRLQDHHGFPEEIRNLAAEANLPVPSWHVGRYYDYEDGPSFMERAINSSTFNKMLESGFMPLRAIAASCLVAYSFSKTIGNPELLDEL